MDVKREVKEHLTGKLIPFWSNLRDQENGGYIGYVDFDLRANPTAAKGCILNSRILWFFSQCYAALGDPALLACARHAYDFVARFQDAEHGGVYWSCTAEGKPLDTMKHTYAQSFAIYGLTAYAMASGESEPLRQAMALYALIETRMRDEGGYLEAFDREFHPLDNAKLSDNPTLMSRGLVADRTMNTILHVMEAYTLLFQATRNAAVGESLRLLLMTVGEQVYNREANRLEVFFDAGMHSLLDMQSYGHDIEASWLIDLAAQAILTGEERDRVERDTTRLAQGVLERALRNGYLLNERVEGEDDPTRIWWVQAETLVGMTNLWQKTADAETRAHIDAGWAYIREHLIDPREGSEWYWCLDEHNAPVRKPLVEPWKCPYHNGRMCLELMKRLP